MCCTYGDCQPTCISYLLGSISRTLRADGSIQTVSPLVGRLIRKHLSAQSAAKVNLASGAQSARRSWTQIECLVGSLWILVTSASVDTTSDWDCLCCCSSCLKTATIQLPCRPRRSGRQGERQSTDWPEQMCRNAYDSFIQPCFCSST